MQATFETHRQRSVEPQLNYGLTRSSSIGVFPHLHRMNSGTSGKLAYTVVEAAELLSLSRASLYRLMDWGAIGSVTIGRSRRITAHQLEQYVERLEAQAIGGTIPSR